MGVQPDIALDSNAKLEKQNMNEPLMIRASFMFFFLSNCMLSCVTGQLFLVLLGIFFAN